MISQRACFDTHQAEIMLIMHNSTPCIRTEKPYVTQIIQPSEQPAQMQTASNHVALHNSAFRSVPVEWLE